MTIKSSGSQLAFSEIETEFGANGTRSLGSYRLTQSVGTLSNLPLDTGVPTSGTIKFSDFYGKSLNIVVDCFSNSSTDEFRINAKKNKSLVFSKWKAMDMVGRLINSRNKKHEVVDALAAYAMSESKDSGPYVIAK